MRDRRTIRRQVGLRMLWLLLLPALAVGVQAQGEGILSGQVINGTAGGAAIGAGIPVTLRILRDGSEAGRLETTTEADGSFRFEGLDPDPALEYRLEATYRGAINSHPEPLQFEEGQTSLEATLTVYETTADADEIVVNSAHLIVESFGPVLRISEIHLFGNQGDRLYIGQAEGEAARTLFIPLPAGAVGLAVQDEQQPGRFVQVEGGLWDSKPVPPGRETSTAFFSYHLMVSGETLSLERTFAYPVTTLNVLVAQPGPTLSSEQLQGGGVESFQGQQYRFFSAQNLAADMPLVLSLTVQPAAAGSQGMPGASAEPAGPAAGTTPGSQGLLRGIGLGLALLAALGAAVYPFTVRREGRRPAGAPGPLTTPTARRLLADLADLEESFEAGQVSEDRFQQRRVEIYQALKAL